MRRRAQRRGDKDGRWVIVPEPGLLTSWETAAASAPDLGADEKRVISGIARLVRRAVIVDGARPGQRVWIGWDDLGRVS